MVGGYSGYNHRCLEWLYHKYANMLCSVDQNPLFTEHIVCPNSDGDVPYRVVCMIPLIFSICDYFESAFGFNVLSLPWNIFLILFPFRDRCNTLYRYLPCNEILVRVISKLDCIPNLCLVRQQCWLWSQYIVGLWIHRRSCVLHSGRTVYCVVCGAGHQGILRCLSSICCLHILYLCVVYGNS